MTKPAHNLRSSFVCVKFSYIRVFVLKTCIIEVKSWYMLDVISLHSPSQMPYGKLSAAQSLNFKSRGQFHFGVSYRHSWVCEHVWCVVANTLSVTLMTCVLCLLCVCVCSLKGTGSFWDKVSEKKWVHVFFPCPLFSTAKARKSSLFSIQVFFFFLQ